MTAASAGSTRGGSRRVEVLPDAEALAHRAADEVVAVLGEAVERRGLATWVLAGGSTPRPTYELLAACPDALDWRRVELYWGDERCVEPVSPQSNYRLVRETLLAALPISGERVNRIHGERPPAEAARLYAEEVEAALARGPFDLVLLGLGADGHTASLFPAPGEMPGGLAAAVEAPVEPHRRVTLTPEALRHGRRLVYLVSGRDKAPAVARALDPGSRGGLVTDRVLPEEGTILWLLDRQAAAELAGANAG